MKDERLRVGLGEREFNEMEWRERKEKIKEREEDGAVKGRELSFFPFLFY